MISVQPFCCCAHYINSYPLVCILSFLCPVRQKSLCLSGCYKCQSLLFYTLRIFSRLIPVLVYFCLFLEVWFPLSLSFVFYSFTLTYINIYQGAGIHIIAHWRSEGSFQELTLSFHHKSTGGQIQIIMPTQGPLPTEPSHCPRFIILKKLSTWAFSFLWFFFF